MLTKVPWKYGQFGPGGGSLPANIIATGAIAPFSPMDVRHDIQSGYVQDRTRIPVAQRPGFTPTGPAKQGPPADGALLGATPSGRPVREFQMPGNPNAIEARQLAAGARRVAQIMHKQGLNNLPGELVGGPIAALARGEAAVLRWPNGVVVGVGP